MNKCFLIGNLTRDPELTSTQGGISVCKFTIAVNRRYTNSAGEREADFINIIAWRELADNCARFLAKGKKVAVMGALQIRTFDGQDGVKRYFTEIVADEVQFLSPSDGTRRDVEGMKEENSNNNSQKKSADELKPLDDDSLPF
ncbi:MAG: single-stranded DNA-binding protein [Firmicutes bacterium]|nr:single-stranded DNA-binding protein [Bacillota bacterium]